MLNFSNLKYLQFTSVYKQCLQKNIKSVYTQCLQNGTCKHFVYKQCLQNENCKHLFINSVYKFNIL